MDNEELNPETRLYDTEFKGLPEDYIKFAQKYIPPDVQESQANKAYSHQRRAEDRTIAQDERQKRRGKVNMERLAKELQIEPIFEDPSIDDLDALDDSFIGSQDDTIIL